MNYQKKLNNFFRHLNQSNGVLNKIKIAKLEYNNVMIRGNGEKVEKKAKSKVTRLEKQLERHFEINENKFLIYKDETKSKIELEIDREILENVDTYLKIITMENKKTKQNILKIKYEILFDLIDVDKGTEILTNLEDSTNNVESNNKIINNLLIKKTETRKKLEEDKVSNNLSLQQVIANLKVEQNKELRKELLTTYNNLLVIKQNIHDKFQNMDIIEYKIGGSTITQNDVELSNVEDLQEEKSE